MSSLRALHRWAHQRWLDETPALQHSISRLAQDGDPVMHGNAAAYLALTAPPDYLDAAALERRWNEADRWLRVASRTDEDGRYRTPLRRALETLPPERRALARDLAADILTPAHVGAIHGIPAWCQGDVFYRTLSMLRAAYLEQPEAPIGYLSRSEAQRSAEAVA